MLFVVGVLVFAYGVVSFSICERYVFPLISSLFIFLHRKNIVSLHRPQVSWLSLLDVILCFHSTYNIGQRYLGLPLLDRHKNRSYFFLVQKLEHVLSWENQLLSQAGRTCVIKAFLVRWLLLPCLVSVSRNTFSIK